MLEKLKVYGQYLPKLTLVDITDEGKNPYMRSYRLYSYVKRLNKQLFKIFK